MYITYATGRLYTAAAPTEAPDTSDAVLIRSIAAGDKGAMRILFALPPWLRLNLNATEGQRLAKAREIMDSIIAGPSRLGARRRPGNKSGENYR